MYRRQLLFIFLLLSCASQAQFSTNDSRWGITLGPAFVSTPRISFALQPGAEYRLGERFYLLADIAFPVFNLHLGNDSAVDKNYLRFKAEARYLFHSEPKKRIRQFLLSRVLGFNKYIGLQTSYAFRNFRDVNGGSHFVDNHTDTIVVAFDHASVKSPIFTATIQFGTIYDVTDNFYIDAFIGIGSRTIHTKYSNVTNPHIEAWSASRNPFGSRAYFYPGNVTRVHMNAGIRFIYRFD